MRTCSGLVERDGGGGGIAEQMRVDRLAEGGAGMGDDVVVGWMSLIVVPRWVSHKALAALRPAPAGPAGAARRRGSSRAPAPDRRGTAARSARRSWWRHPGSRATSRRRAAPARGRARAAPGWRAAAGGWRAGRSSARRGRDGHGGGGAGAGQGCPRPPAASAPGPRPADHGRQQPATALLTRLCDAILHPRSVPATTQVTAPTAPEQMRRAPQRGFQPQEQGRAAPELPAPPSSASRPV